MYIDHPQMSRGDDYTFWKDIAEPPIVLLFSASLIGTFFNNMLFLAAALFFIAILIILEIIYSARMNNSITLIFFYSVAMVARAFVSTAGFVVGFFLGWFAVKCFIDGADQQIHGIENGI